MKIAEISALAGDHQELDLRTIRRRVAKIKQSWTPEIAQARAAEGARRRRELDALVNQWLGERREDGASYQSTLDRHGLSLIG